MTHQDDYNLSPKTAAELAKNGWEAIPEMIRILVNQAMQEERARYLQADEYERSDDRKGYANGYKPKRVKTRVGEITFSIPQVRESGFYPSALEKGMRSERALVMSLAEMYVHGVSTRKVKEITEQLCGVEISAAQVSRATAQLDQVLQEWRERPLGEIPYLYLDARYEKVRQSGQVRDAGRVVLSRLFDIYFEPDFQLWARIGDGLVFSGTRATHSFTAKRSGRLWLASYAPGQWADLSGKLATPESVYRGIRGGISVLLIRWADGALAGLESCEPDRYGFRALELDRLTNAVSCPENWNYLWFLGDAEIYRAQTGDDARPEIACITRGDGAILQHDLDVPFERDSRLSWNWRIDQLPSAFAEDLLPTHDYLSIAVEFDNGIDLTYHWSAGLPIGTGYWCPLPTWKKREFHVAIRSGAQGLGQWIHEERDLHADYQRYIGRPPRRIVRVWLIANSVFQRKQGRCTYREIRVTSPNIDEQVL